jgi:cellulose synthase/poly-beta-1,6-N-acetylglucosamine synthase-like glycosyltransferase
LAVVYLWSIGIVGIAGRKRYPYLTRAYDFLILVPAHNEASVIAPTLKRLKELQPVGQIEIAVIADNCEDNTADIARKFDVSVMERFDESNRGKGHALRWGIDRYNLDDFHAIAIVDADTYVEKNLLEVMAGMFEDGAGAVQVSDQFYIEKPTSLSHLQQLGNMAENMLFYKGRSILNLPILLRGTGMAIKSEVLKKYPWSAFTITEDVDYAVTLIKNGIRICFSAETAVKSPATSSYKQSYTQKERWVSGTFGLILKRSFDLVIAAFKKGRPALLELAFSFLVLSRPLLIFVALIPLLLSFFIASDLATIFIIWAASLILLLVFYLLAGIFYVDNKKRALKSLLHLPFFGAWLLMLQVRAIFRGGRSDWTRTERGAR